jgi:hypothetical protein
MVIAYFSIITGMIADVYEIEHAQDRGIEEKKRNEN